MPGPYWKIILAWNAIALMGFLILPFEARMWAVLACMVLMTAQIYRRYRRQRIER